MASPNIRPTLLVADSNGNIHECPELLMVCRHGPDLLLPRPDDLMPLPEGSRLILWPGTPALGLEQESGILTEHENLTVAAIPPPGVIISAHPASLKPEQTASSAALGQFACGAIGFANGRIYICAKKYADPPALFSVKKLRRAVNEVLDIYPRNNLLKYMANECVQIRGCRYAANIFLKQPEIMLPLTSGYNANIQSCLQIAGGEAPNFTPKVSDLVELMLLSSTINSQSRISFSLECTGEPLLAWQTLHETLLNFRSQNKTSTVSLSTNACNADSVNSLAQAGLSALAVRLNSARSESYNLYMQPQGYNLDDVYRSLEEAVKHNLETALELMFFPGFSDSELEVEALISLLKKYGITHLKLCNLPGDPLVYLNLMNDVETGPAIGLNNYKKRLLRELPELQLGYFSSACNSK